MTDKKQKAKKVKIANKTVNIYFAGRWTQHFAKIDQKTRKIGQIYIWNHKAAGFIM